MFPHKFVNKRINGFGNLISNKVTSDACDNRKDDKEWNEEMKIKREMIEHFEWHTGKWLEEYTPNPPVAKPCSYLIDHTNMNKW